MSKVTAEAPIAGGVTIRPGQLARILAGAIQTGHPVLITGAPGIGKSDITYQACVKAGVDMILSHPSVSDPTDAKGLPWPCHDGERAMFLPFGDLEAAIHATKPTVWFLDDLGQATPAVQASYMQLTLARRINGNQLPPYVTFVAATNRRTDRAGVSGILEPVKSRFTIYELATNLEDWVEWAVPTGIHPHVLGFLRFRPDLLHAFTPTADMENSPNPRTWAKLSMWLTAGIHPDDELATCAGNVGQGAASEFVAFLRVARDVPDLDSVIEHPDKAPIPVQPNSLYALTAALAYRVTIKNFPKVYCYAERLLENKRAEFGVLLIRDAYRREPAIKATPTFAKIYSSELGALIIGKE